MPELSFRLSHHFIPIPESVLDVPYSYMGIAEAKNMPEVFRSILALFKSRYINAEQYLKFIGLNQKEISRIKRKV